MAQTILVKFYNPVDIMNVTPETTDEEIKEACFRVVKYETAFDCLQAYANTPVAWSKIMDDTEDYMAFVNTAYEHIKARDYEWLEKNFV